MTSQGSPYTRFRRYLEALLTRNLMIIRGAAAELPLITLPDALEICLVMRDVAPHRFDAAATRWIARLCLEQPGVTLADVDAAVAAFSALRADP